MATKSLITIEQLSEQAVPAGVPAYWVKEQERLIRELKVALDRLQKFNPKIKIYFEIVRSKPDVPEPKK